MAVLGETGMLGYRILQAQATEPAVGQIELDYFAQAPLGTNAIAVADDEHADHQLRVARGPASSAVKAGQMPAQVPEIKEAVNYPQQVNGRDVVLQAQGNFPVPLCNLTSRHGRLLQVVEPYRNPLPKLFQAFFNRIGRK